ncbi:hypothetical protein [Serratia fonticola]|uniref:hypothetical protein n=1 Tax=Serratia fonticola TaxID=47917 RepID=UPI0021ADAA2E|nr:hypothetical protein [Serratia fonticola]
MMRSAPLLLALLFATPLCQASMNTLAASELPRAMLAQTCNVLNVPQADWGDINAVVRSARACLSQKQGRGQTHAHWHQRLHHKGVMRRYYGRGLASPDHRVRVTYHSFCVRKIAIKHRCRRHIVKRH